MSEKGNKKQTNKGEKAKKSTETPKPATTEEVANTQQTNVNNNNNNNNASSSSSAAVNAPTNVATTNANKEEVANPSSNTDAAQQPKKERAPKIQHREKGRGSVKAVLSGDTLVVINLEKNQQGPPSEKEITISNIKAPRLGRRANDKRDKMDEENFAWQSREYLRKKSIGRQIVYVLESKNQETSRHWGSVLLLSKMSSDKVATEENLAHEIVRHGWAEVKRPKGEKDKEEIEALAKLEEEARRNKIGMFATNIPAARPFNQEPDYTELFSSLSKTAQTGVIEKVKNGSSLRITLLPSLLEVNLLLSGVEAGQNNKQVWEPFGREAKFFTEHYLLNREVQIILEGVDKKTFYGTVSYQNKNISEELLRAGLGRFVEWSGNRTASAEKLRAAEKEAQDKKLRLWSNYTAPKPLTKQEMKKVLKVGKEVIGKVIDISHLGYITVLADGNNPTKVPFASVRIPRPPVPKDENANNNNNNSNNANSNATSNGSNAPTAKPAETKEQKQDAFDRYLAHEVREFLRKRIMGQRVKCVLDYTRQIKRGNHTEEEAFYSVYADKNNIAVELAEQGLAQVQEHRMGEPRSRDYEMILIAEGRAKSAHRGLWTPQKDWPGLRMTDLSLDKNREKAKLMVGTLKSSGRMKGIVEYVFSAHRYKIFIPRENTQLIFTISGIRVPSRGKDKQRNEEDEELFEEAVQCAKDLVLLRDVEIEIAALEKTGNFLGNIWVNRQSVACKLLEAGFAQVNRAGKDSDSAREFSIAEEEGKRGKKKMWKNYDAEAEEQERQRRKEEKEKEFKPREPEKISLIVTEILDASKFYIQNTKGVGKLDEISQQLNSASENAGSEYVPKKDEIVKAQFTSDDKWYRAKVLNVSEKEASVFYVDYGNSETVPFSRIRKLESKLAEPSFFALPAKLAFISPINLKSEFGMEAAEFFRDQVENKTMSALIEYDENGILYLTLGEPSSVNVALIREGFARVERVRGKHYKDKIEALEREQGFAKQRHLNIWQYGDPGSDDEETPRLSRKTSAVTTSSAPTATTTTTSAAQNKNANNNTSTKGAEGKQEK